MACALVLACTSRNLTPLGLDRIATLGADGGPGALASQVVVSARLSDGARIVIAAGATSAAPAVYDANGHFTGSLSLEPARPWDGPRFVRTGPGDSIWVFGATRAYVFDPTRHLVRSVPLPFTPWDALVLDNGAMLLSSSSANDPLPLVQVSPRGDNVHRFDVDSAEIGVAAPRWIVDGHDGTCWTIPMQQQWRLEHWDASGRRIAVVNRDPGWLRRSPAAAPEAGIAPAPAILGAWIDHAGHLWVIGSAPDAHWTAGLSRAVGGMPAAVADPDKVFDTIVEEVDLASGRDLRLVRLDVGYASVVEPGVLLHFRSRPNGWLSAELFAMRTKDPG